MPLGSLEDILSQVASYKAGAESAAQKLNPIYQTMQEAQMNIAVQSTNNARDESTIESVKKAGELQTQARVAKVADDFNTDILKQGNEITSLAAQQKALFETKMESARTIAEKQQVGLFDDPLQYIKNQFTINDDIAEHNAANQQFNAIQTRIATLNQNTQASIATQRQLETGIDETSAAAASRVAGYKSRIAATNAEITALKYGADGIAAVLGASKESLNASQTAFAAMNADQQIKLGQAQLQLAKENAAERTREFNERMDEKADERQQGSYMVDSINKGRAARGLMPLDPMEGKMAVRGLMGKGGIIKSEWQGDYAAGQRIDSGVSGSIAANPIDLISRQASGTPLNLTAQQKPILDVAEQAVQIIHAAQNPDSVEAKKYKGLVGLDPKKDPESFKSAVNTMTQILIKDQSAKVNYEDRNNIFNIPNIKTIAANQPVVANLPVYQKVLKPVIDSGIDLSNPKAVFNLIGDAFANGTITYKEAIDATTIYHVGVGINAAQRNTMGVAGVAMPMQYNAEIEINPNGLIGKKATINLTDPSQFGRALIQSQSHRLGQQLIGISKDIPLASQSQEADSLMSGVNGIVSKVPTLISDKSNTPQFRK